MLPRLILRQSSRKEGNILTLRSLSIIIPAYNESLRLPSTLDSLADFINGFEFRQAFSGLIPDVCIVDDGSIDQTAETALKHLSRIPNLRVVRLSENIGKGGAIRAGCKTAMSDWHLIADADGSTDWRDLLSFWSGLQQNSDAKAVYGSRSTNDSVTSDRSLIRGLGAWGLNRIVRWMTGIQLKDTQCGFKLIEGSLSREFSTFGKQNRFSWDIELLVFLNDMDAKVLELPVHWSHKDGSKLRPIQDALRLILETRTIIRNRRRKKSIRLSA